jgi:hypothetical protein
MGEEGMLGGMRFTATIKLALNLFLRRFAFPFRSLRAQFHLSILPVENGLSKIFQK